MRFVGRRVRYMHNGEYKCAMVLGVECDGLLRLDTNRLIMPESVTEVVV